MRIYARDVRQIGEQMWEINLLPRFALSQEALDVLEDLFPNTRSQIDRILDIEALVQSIVYREGEIISSNQSVPDKGGKRRDQK